MDAIKAGAWDTVLGKMEFDAKGDIKQIDYVVYKWDAKGGYTEIEPEGDVRRSWRQQAHSRGAFC